MRVPIKEILYTINRFESNIQIVLVISMMHYLNNVKLSSSQPQPTLHLSFFLNKGLQILTVCSMILVLLCLRTTNAVFLVRALLVGMILSLRKKLLV